MKTADTHLDVLKTHKLYIGGQFPRTESGRTYALAKPGAKKPYAQLCLASRKDLRAAVEAALGAQHGWAARSAYNRGQILYRMAEMIESRAESWQSLLRQGLGLSPAQAQRALDGTVDALVYYAGATDKYPQVIGAVNPVAGPHHNFTTPEPVGVIGLLFPDEPSLLALVSLVAPAILSGNAAVVLASETHPLPALTFAEILATSDLPAGVLNLLAGRRCELLPHFATHMEINAVVDGAGVPDVTQALQTGHRPQSQTHRRPRPGKRRMVRQRR
jgi:acyl-CoA reductase-like NAD-dependent aldehyde dehydrogenase